MVSCFFRVLTRLATGPELLLHVGGVPAAAHGPPEPLRRLLDLQLPLDLLPQQRASVFQALLELGVQNVSVLQTQQFPSLETHGS
ncbi:hypothetical protein EYF80_066633 [Liparis tanakae]|uniref:Uncharacterized protein n=1 Tax=Liparis tanakae TaxID=230148 RepID=A0A4Z2E3B6_9TELE|nr:hypothetical protein EYF80_066633 [Liparis tanakae]